MLKRPLLLLLFFCLTAGSAQAQQESVASQTFKQRLRGQYLQNDTAQAIINLYGIRQGGGAGWIVAAALAAVRIASAPNRSTVNGMVVSQESNAGLAFVFALPIAGYGAAKIARYSNGKLERVLTSYAAGQPLPRSLRRRLKPRFFKQPIIKYQPVNARPVK